jgi:CubicO group peptidase (beta-lactamase class C family)
LTASTQQIIDRLRETRPVILSVFGNPYTLEKLENLQELEGLLITYQPDSVGEKVAAQVIFGGTGASGKLPVSSGSFEAGTGIETAGGIRFGYTYPEEVGIDSRFLYSSIDSLMQLALDSQATPGAQILIAKDGKMIFEKAYGHHTYEAEHPVDLDDIYDFASITKITGSLPALMKLDDEGKIGLDQTLGELYPEFSRSNKADIKLLDLLTHQGRLVAWIPFWKNTIRNSGKFKWFTFRSDSSRRFPVKVADNLYLHRKYDRKIYKAIRKSPLRDSVEYVYSDLGFYLYPKVVERITGQNFYDYLDENFYGPLGASTITFNPWQKYPLDRIVPTEYDSAFRKSLLHGRVDDEGAAMLNGISGHAGLFGTGRDLAKVMQMYLQMGEYGGKRYLGPMTMKEYTSCPYCSIGNRRGIGFDKPQIERSPNGNTAVSVSDESFGHSGFTGTFTWVDPANGLLYVFMSNRVHPTREHTQLYRLNTRTNIQEVIYQALEAEKEHTNP